MSAAADLARYPWVMEYRLVDVVGSIPPVPETTENTEEEDIRNRYHRLGRAKFMAVKGGHPINLELIQERKVGSQIPFKVESYLTRRDLKMRLFVLELDEDEPSD
jgi:hypothetical protein